jgi:hypothetical protein
MKIGLFIPCYIDASFPEVGVATLESLERLGCSAEYPLDQTCWGQPMANSKLRTDVAAPFAKGIGTDPEDTDPHHLAEAMRQNARPRFLAADAGMTGANFAVAETGGFVVCTNEGNAEVAPACRPCTSSASASRRWSRVPATSGSSAGSSRAAPWTRRPGSTPPTSTARGGAGSCTWCWWKTPDAIASARLARLLARRQLHPLRGVHEHLPGLPPGWRLELRGDVLRPDRRDTRPRL